MYTVKIVRGSIKEINNVMNKLELPLRDGVTTKSIEYARSIECAAMDVEPMIELEISLVA